MWIRTWDGAGEFADQWIGGNVVGLGSGERRWRTKQLSVRTQSSEYERMLLSDGSTVCRCLSHSQGSKAANANVKEPSAMGFCSALGQWQLKNPCSWWKIRHHLEGPKAVNPKGTTSNVKTTLLTRFTCSQNTQRWEALSASTESSKCKQGRLLVWKQHCWWSHHTSQTRDRPRPVEAFKSKVEKYMTAWLIASNGRRTWGRQLSSHGCYQILVMHYTGGRGGITQGVSFEFFESFLLIYSHNTLWVNFEFFQKLLTTLIKTFSLGNFWNWSKKALHLAQWVILSKNSKVLS